MKINFTALPTGDNAATWTTLAGTEMQVVSIGDAGVLFGARRPGGTWAVLPIDNPQRFGDWKTSKGMKAWAEAFLTDLIESDG